MLRSEFPIPLKNRTARIAVFILGEAFLGFLAIVAVALALFQMWFSLTTAGDALVTAAQAGIIGLFALEYAVAFAFATNKRAFFLNPWRLVDLVTIIIPILTLLPGVSNALRSSPVLRLVRLIRLATLGLRVSGVVAREHVRQVRAEETAGPVEVCVVPHGDGKSATSSSWEEFLGWMKSPEDEPKWFSVSNLGRSELQTVARAANVPITFLESHLLNASYPHVEVEQQYAAVFVWLIETPQQQPVHRKGVLMLVSEDGLVTLSRQATELTKLIKGLHGEHELAKLLFPVRMACSILQLIVDQNELLSARLEGELNALEELPLRESRPAFFERTFRLKKELSVAQSDLWRLKGVLNELGEQRAKFPGSNGREAEFLRRLAHDAEYLYDTVVNTREGLLSLIDLHLNIVSFDMNRVMRVLAVVSVLGLIPAVVGGLFGMNLIDNPWPFTLQQVAFFVCFGMVLTLYLFFVKGWLR